MKTLIINVKDVNSLPERIDNIVNILLNLQADYMVDGDFNGEYIKDIFEKLQEIKEILQSSLVVK